jgi:hypothetical protein
MQLVSPKSLSETIDRVNRAYFYDAIPSKQERGRAIQMILSCAGGPHSYRRNTFGLTPTDERGRTYTFTGEGLNSRVSRNHIHAEEACRCLIILNRSAARQLSELESATQSLLDIIRRCEADGKAQGTFCCGPCTVAMWSHMAVGGLGGYAKHLNAGLAVLDAHQDGKGTWRRFPFFVPYRYRQRCQTYLMPNES